MAAYIPYSPASLPPVTAVDIVVLSGLNPDRVNLYMQAADGALTVTLEGDAADKISQLWRQLPPGEQSRCHTPPYGVRFRIADRVVVEASICWHCSNIFGTVEEQEMHYEFNVEHPAAKELFTEMERATSGRQSPQ